MSERLTRRVEALESKAGSKAVADIEIIFSIWAPGPNGPIRLRDLAQDGTTVLREYEHSVPSTEPKGQAK